MDCRQPQKQVLEKLLKTSAYPTALSIHGPRGTGKTTALSQFLKSANISSSWVQCDQCATTRIILQRALRRIFETTRTGEAEDANCENVDIFLSLVEKKFAAAQYTSQHVLVLDRIDQFIDARAVSHLLVSLTRIPELTNGLSNLIVIFVYSTSDPRALATNLAVPRLWFPRFTKSESTQILLASINGICLENSSLSYEFKEGFIELVINALGPSAGTDIDLLKRMARKIWPEFSKDVSSSDSIAKVYIRKSHLFQADKLTDRLIVADSASSVLQVTPLTCYLLCAAYLASYNSPRYDMRYFSLAKTVRNKRRETKPKKAVTIPSRSLAPPAFEMERLMAIFHAINPLSFEFQQSVSISREIATLEAQKLITKSASDPLDSRTKWKINVPWSYVQRTADEIGFNIEDYLVESI